MPELALYLWGAYYLLTLGIRLVLHRRRTGSSGLVGFRGRPGSTEWLGEAAEVVALALGFAAPVLALGGTVPLIPALDLPGVHVAGVALFALGVAGIVGSQQAMGASWRIGVDHGHRTTLVTRGPFAIVRNPIFTSLVAVQAGIALLAPSWVAMLALALLVLSVEVQVRGVEEPHLLQLHGGSYAAYAGRVGRFLPRVGRASHLR